MRHGLFRLKQAARNYFADIAVFNWVKFLSIAANSARFGSTAA